MAKSFRVFYTEFNNIISVSFESDTIITENREERNTNNYNYFEMMKGYQKTNEDLLRFKKDFIQWRNELLKYEIDYTKYYTNFYATFYNFKKFKIIFN